MLDKEFPSSLYIRVYILWMNLLVQLVLPFVVLLVLNYKTYEKIVEFERNLLASGNAVSVKVLYTSGHHRHRHAKRTGSGSPTELTTTTTTCTTSNNVSGGQTAEDQVRIILENYNSRRHGNNDDDVFSDEDEDEDGDGKVAGEGDSSRPFLLGRPAAEAGARSCPTSPFGTLAKSSADALGVSPGGRARKCSAAAAVGGGGNGTGTSNSLSSDNGGGNGKSAAAVPSLRRREVRKFCRPFVSKK